MYVYINDTQCTPIRNLYTEMIRFIYVLYQCWELAAAKWPNGQNSQNSQNGQIQKALVFIKM